MTLGLIHLPLVGYFGAISGLASLVVPGIVRAKQTRGSVLFLALAAASLVATWTYMGLYFRRSFLDAARERGVAPAAFETREWLTDVSLFHEAWHYVCATAARYWWSEQLMYWTTGPLAILMSVEGRRRGVKLLWVYMLLGQIVAVSFAQSLFFAALALVPRVAPRAPSGGRPLGPPAGQTWQLLAAVVLGAIGTTLVPARVETGEFLPLLVAIHVVAVVPLVDSVLPDWRVRLPPSRLYFNYAFIALRLRWATVAQLVDVAYVAQAPVRRILPAVKSLFVAEWQVLNSHPAQASISWDVVCATLSAVAFCVYDNATEPESELVVPYELVALLVVATPVVGLQSTVAMYLAVREGKRESFEQKLRHQLEDDKDHKKD
ncbi:hypothetical protein JCM11491_001578 [Sporobolomyces phaffii]